MVAFGRPLYRAGMVSRWLVARALWSQLVFQHRGADEERMRKFRESALRVTRGWDQARVSAIVRETLTEVIDPDRLRRGARPHPPPPGRRAPGVPHLRLTRGDRCPPGPVPGRRRSHRQPGQPGRGRPLHRRGRVLQLRALQGPGHRAGGGRTGDRPGRFLRLFGLRHRPAHARGGGPSGGREPRSRPGPGGAPARLGGPAVPPRRAPARTRAHAGTPSDGDGSHRGGRRGDGHRRVVAVAPPSRRARPPPSRQARSIVPGVPWPGPRAAPPVGASGVLQLLHRKGGQGNDDDENQELLHGAQLRREPPGRAQ